MSTAAAMIVILSNHGYWFGGQPGIIRVSWAASGAMPQAVLVWDLRVDGARLEKGRLALSEGEAQSELTLTVPEVRVPTIMKWHYLVQAREGGGILSEGEKVIHAYPGRLLAGLDRLWKGKGVLVWDAPDGLGPLLAEAGIECMRITAASDLQLASGQLVLVGPDRLGKQLFDQTPLLGLARAGAGVLVFAQTKVDALLGFGVATRRGPAALEWEKDHPLLQGLAAENLRDLTDVQVDLRAIRLPADAPVLEISYWPREVPGDRPVPIDALLAVQTVGAGRIVFCQIPFGPWRADPRSQLLLANALQYLTTRPEPTLPPSQRRIVRPIVPASSPTITIPPGGRP